MNWGQRGRDRDTNTGENLLIFEAIPGMRPRALRVHRFFRYSRIKAYLQYSTYIIVHVINLSKYIYNMVYNILPIMLSIVAFILYCVISPLFREYLKKWRARWDCGRTPRELLIDRASETSPSVPNATTRPQFWGFCIEDNRLRPDISAYIHFLVDRLAITSKTLKFEEKHHD
jgi:hypothetical protein